MRNPDGMTQGIVGQDQIMAIMAIPAILAISSLERFQPGLQERQEIAPDGGEVCGYQGQ